MQRADACLRLAVMRQRIFLVYRMRIANHALQIDWKTVLE
jgi:hypothetical protein